MNIANLRNVSHMRVTRVVVYEGTGTVEDPGREIIYYFDENDSHLFTFDPMEKHEPE